MTGIKLYGWEISPYTKKVEAFLRLKGLPHAVRPPNAVTLKTRIKKDVGQMIMPVVYDERGRPLQDSTVIMDILEERYPARKMIPVSSEQNLACRIIELFGDDWLPLPNLHYRWNYPKNAPFITREFGKNALPYFPGPVQNWIARPFIKKMKGYLPILGITKKMEDAIESSTEMFLETLAGHLKKEPYILGQRPSAADVSLYGPLFAHLHRDPFPENLVEKHQPLAAWIDRIHSPSHPAIPPFDPEDKIPESLFAVLRLISKLQWPLLMQVRAALEEWARDKPPGTRVPRKLGMATLTLGEHSEERVNISYAYWMLQRAADTCQELMKKDQNGAEHFLSNLEYSKLLTEPVSVRTELRRCRLYLV